MDKSNIAENTSTYAEIFSCWCCFCFLFFAQLCFVNWPDSDVDDKWIWFSLQIAQATIFREVTFFVCLLLFFALFLAASNFCSYFCRSARAFQIACIMDSGQKEDSRNIYLLTFSAVSKQTKWYYDETAWLRTWASGEIVHAVMIMSQQKC